MGRVRELLCSELFSYNHALVLEKVEQAEFMDEERYGSTDMDKEENDLIESSCFAPLGTRFFQVRELVSGKLGWC